MIQLDQYPDHLKVPARQVVFLGAPRPGEEAFVYGSAVVTIVPKLTDFSWKLKNDIRDIRWDTLVWLVGERFVLELTDLENAISGFRAYLSHGEVV